MTYQVLTPGGVPVSGLGSRFIGLLGLHSRVLLRFCLEGRRSQVGVQALSVEMAQAVGATFVHVLLHERGTEGWGVTMMASMENQMETPCPLLVPSKGTAVPTLLDAFISVPSDLGQFSPSHGC